MAQNEHKKVLQELSEAYQNVINEGHAGPVPDWEKQAGLKDELEANRKAARQDVEEDGGGDHDKGVQMALEALEMFKDELHVGGHGEDINVNELADAHDQLSRALHWLLDETDVEFITGGRATQQAERDVDFKPAHGEY